MNERISYLQQQVHRDEKFFKPPSLDFARKALRRKPKNMETKDVANEILCLMDLEPVEAKFLRDAYFIRSSKIKWVNILESLPPRNPFSTRNNSRVEEAQKDFRSLEDGATKIIDKYVDEARALVQNERQLADMEAILNSISEKGDEFLSGFSPEDLEIITTGMQRVETYKLRLGRDIFQANDPVFLPNAIDLTGQWLHQAAVSGQSLATAFHFKDMSPLSLEGEVEHQNSIIKNAREKVPGEIRVFVNNLSTTIDSLSEALPYSRE